MLAVAQTSLDMSHHTTMPPNDSGRVTFPNNFSLSGVWTISDADLEGEKITSRTGLIVWLPWRGLASIWRMGIVPSGTTTVGAILGTIDATWTRDCAVPYALSAGQVRLGQDVTRDFSVTRMVAAHVNVSSRGIAIGSTAITGKVTWGVVADTRDIEKLGWRPEAIVQQTPVSKDAALQQNIADGVDMILACDIPTMFSVPNRDNHWSENGEKQVFELALDNLPAMNVAAGTTVDTNLPPVFISPRGLTLAGHTSLQTEAIGIAGQCKHFMHFHATYSTIQPPQQSGLNCLFTVNFQDVFAILLKTGQIVYTFAPPVTRPYVLPPDSPLEYLIAFRGEYISIDHADLLVTNDQGGMYVGTRIYITVTNASNAAFDVRLAYCFAGTVSIDLFNEGEVGPARIVRYDGVSEGQQLTVTGSLLVECVPEGNIAPFIIPTERIVPRAVSINIYNFLSIMYNSKNTLFKRMWQSAEYVKLITSVVPNLTIDKLEAWDDEQGTLMNAAHVNGLDMDRLGGRPTSKTEDAGESEYAGDARYVHYKRPMNASRQMW